MQLLPILRKSPFGRLLFFYASGISSANIFIPDEGFVRAIITGIPVLFMALLIAVRFLISYRTMWLNGLLAAFILCLAGLLNMSTQILSGKRLMDFDNKAGTYLMIIEDQPEVKERTYKVTARVIGFKNAEDWEKAGFRVLLYIQKDSSAAALKTGSGIIAETLLKRNPVPGNPEEFNYCKYLANKGIFLQGYISSQSWMPGDYGNRMKLRSTAYRMRDNLMKSYAKLDLAKPETGLLSAITLGYRNDIDAHTKQIFTQAGVMHVMALSGFNVGIIAILLGFVLGIFNISRAGRVSKTIIIIAALWLFALITGLSPSVTRATVMISFVLAGKVMQRQINTYNILFASAFVLLAFSPGMLNDVSFQLSFAAVIGIIGLHPLLYRSMTFRHKAVDLIWKLFTVSCAAQLSTMPLTLYYFHQFPVYFWITNLYVVPMVSLIICVAGAYLLLSFVSPLGLALGKVLAILVKALMISVGVIEEMPYSLLDSIYINPLQVFLLFFAILFLGLFLFSRRTNMLLAALSIIVLFQLVQVGHNFHIFQQRIFIVGNVRGESVLQLIAGRNGRLVTGSASDLTASDLTYSFRNFWISRGVNRLYHLPVPGERNLVKSFPMEDLRVEHSWPGANMLFEFAGKRIIFLQDNRFYDFNPEFRLRSDVTVVSGILRPDMEKLGKLLDTGLLVVDSSASKYKAGMWKKMCSGMGIQCWIVSEQGAFLLDAGV